MHQIIQKKSQIITKKPLNNKRTLSVLFLLNYDKPKILGESVVGGKVEHWSPRGGWEQKYNQEAFDTNWVVPLGPNANGYNYRLSNKGIYSYKLHR